MTWATLFWLDTHGLTEMRCHNKSRQYTLSLCSVRSVVRSVTQLTAQRVTGHQGNLAGTTLPRNRPQWQAYRGTCSLAADNRFRY